MKAIQLPLKGFTNILVLDLIAIGIIWLAFRYTMNAVDHSNLEEMICELKETVLFVVALITVYLLADFYLYKKDNNLFVEIICAAVIFIIFTWSYVHYVGLKILTKINPKKENLFWGSSIESVFGNLSSFAAAMTIISFYINKNFDQTFDQIVNIVFLILALLVPIIKMYNFILSEYYEYDKEHSEEIETEVLNKETNGENKGKTQYNNVESFTNTVQAIENLDSLEKNINEKRKKLEKEQFDDIKKFINKFATLEDLDNLEKNIAEKRDKLKNSNTEKRMD